MDPYSSFIEFIRTLLSPLVTWPVSSLTATFVAMLCVFISRAISRLVYKEEELSYALKEIARWEERRKKAIKERDRKLYNQVLREKPRIDRLKNKVAAERIKGNVVSLIVWFLFFRVASDIFAGKTIAVLPILGYAPVTFPIWYVLTSLWFAPLIGRLTGMALGFRGQELKRS